MKRFSIRSVTLEIEGEREALFFLADYYDDARVEGDKLYIRLPLLTDVMSATAASRLLSDYLEKLKDRAKKAEEHYKEYRKISYLLERGKTAEALNDLDIPVIE